MYSKLEEATYPLSNHPAVRDCNYIKCGTFNPSKSSHGSGQRESFLLWRISKSAFEIHEITSALKLQHNSFGYTFAAHSNDTDFRLQPHVEFIEFQENGQNLIALYLLASNWTLYRFHIPHPHQFHREHPNLSVLHQIRDAHPSPLDLMRLKLNNNSSHSRSNSSSRRPFDGQTSFQMLNPSELVLCTANELSIIRIPSDIDVNPEEGPFEFMVHRRKRSDDETSLSMFSSFFGSATLNRSAPSYCCTATHQPVASRTIIGCADNMGHLELYLLSGSTPFSFSSSSSSLVDGGVHLNGDSIRYQVHDQQSVKLPFVPPGGGEQQRMSLLIHGYAPRDGICWFTVLLFYAVQGKGGGAVLQCAYKKSEDVLELHGDFEPLNGIPVQNVDRIDAAIVDRFLWCGVVSSSNLKTATHSHSINGDDDNQNDGMNGNGINGKDADDYDLFFCDIGHYLDKYHRHGAGSSSATKWKFQRMWKRSEYIARILKGMETELKFDSFYDQFSPSLDRMEGTISWSGRGRGRGRGSVIGSRSSGGTISMSSRDAEGYKYKLHELILHFWIIRLVDDPTMELDVAILEAELQRIVEMHSLNAHHSRSRYSNIPWSGVNGVNAINERMGRDLSLFQGDDVKNEAMRRIEFEMKLKNTMISVMELRRCQLMEQGVASRDSVGMDMDGDGGGGDIDIDGDSEMEMMRSREYVQSVWREYSLYFRKCLDSAKSCWKWTGMGSIASLNNNNGMRGSNGWYGLSGGHHRGGRVRSEQSVVIMKQNGFSLLRRLDYAEQIEVYFDRVEDESDELTDFDEPPIRLHKFVAWCQRGRGSILSQGFRERVSQNERGRECVSSPSNYNDIYHWFVACTWFYHQNESVLNHNNFNLDDLLISCSTKEIEEEFADYMESHGEGIQSHTTKQIGDLFLTHNQQIGEFLDDIIAILTSDNYGAASRGGSGLIGFDDAAHSNSNNSNQGIQRNKDYLDRIWSEPELMSCIESSFASMVAARYSLLRSIYVTFLFLKVRSPRMSAVLDVLKGYFILSFLSSSIYATKQSLHQKAWNHNHCSLSTSQSMQSSFRSGLLIRHYLRYWHCNRGDFAASSNGNGIRMDLSSSSPSSSSPNNGVCSCSYLSNPLHFVEEMVSLFLRDRDHKVLMYNVVQFLFCERQFEALQKMVSYIHSVSPLFQYLLARCHIEMDRVHRSTSMDRDAVRLFHECCLKLQAMNGPFDSEHERRLLGFILTADDRMHCVDLYHLAPSEFILFPPDFVAMKRKEDEERRVKESKLRRQPVVLSATKSMYWDCPEYEWCIVTAYYFHIVSLYKHCKMSMDDTSRPKMVIKFAKKGIEYIERHRKRAIKKKKEEFDGVHDDDDDDEDVDDEKVDEEAVRRVSFYGNVSEKEAERLFVAMNGDLECILLSIYKWRLMLEIVSESLKMKRYGAAYRHLMRFEDLQSVSALSAIKEFVAICCQNKAMAPILDNEWDDDSVASVIGGDGDGDGEWRRQLLSFKKTFCIDLKPRSLRNLVESMLYRLALQYEVTDSFCFDLLFTFSMKHCDYHLAAKYMVEYALRIEQCLPKKSASTQRLQHHCLCHVLSAMDLMDGSSATKYLLIDFKIGSDAVAQFLGLSPNTKFITFRQVRSWYIFIECKLALFGVIASSSSKDERTEHEIANLNVMETANELHLHGLYAQSLALRREFECDCCPVFEQMINRLMTGSENKCDAEWHDLEQLLSEYDGVDTQYRYTLGAMKSILTMTESKGYDDGAPFVIPPFMMHKMQSIDLKEDKEVDLLVVPFIEMLTEFGLILEAVRTLCFALNLTANSMTMSNTNAATEHHRYHHQDHSFWKMAQRVFANLNVLDLQKEQKTLMKALAHWIEGAH